MGILNISCIHIVDQFQLFMYPLYLISILQTGINSMGILNSLVSILQTGINSMFIQYFLYPYCRLVSTLCVSSISCIHIVDWYQLYGYPQYILYPYCRLVSTLWVSSIYLVISVFNMVGIVLPQANDFLWFAYKVKEKGLSA